MKTLFLLRGLPGAGKTTVAELLSENGKWPIISADDYFSTSGEYKWEADKISYAHTWCIALAEVAMSGVYPSPDPSQIKLFVHNTFTQEWEMKDYFLLAEKYGYQVVTMIVENRHGSKNIHNVPDETIEKMKNRFQVKL